MAASLADLGGNLPVALFKKCKLIGFTLLKDIDLQVEANIKRACPDLCGRGCRYYISSFLYTGEDFCERCDVFDWEPEAPVQDLSFIALPPRTMNRKTYCFGIEEYRYSEIVYVEDDEVEPLRADLASGDAARLQRWVEYAQRQQQM